MNYKEMLGCDCPEEHIILVEYNYNHPQHYDGISEITCKKCKKRVGRWSGKTLSDGEVENKFGKV